ncbi:MAG TPA: methionine adenosyltransferase, partial [Candidatus Peregrinibacteria bacterium]|nr:methionine adenosyltransferase [Candidatus Peregrinibacteria bacterium]
VKKIITEAVEKYLKKVNRGAQFVIILEIKSGSANLQEVFKKDIPVANDTSFGVSHYPYSKLESLVLGLGKHINSDAFIQEHPAVGRDIKVMGLRIGKKIRLTVAIAFLDKYIRNMQKYVEVKKKVLADIKKKVKFLGGKVEVFLNTLDDPSQGSEASVYLTVTGMSAEMGDDGQVGRGNRYNELITPNRTMSLEAVAGKNINHPGKIYQVMAFLIAKEIVKKTKAKEVEVKLLTQIGAPLDQPEIADVRVLGSDKGVKEVVERNFKNLKKTQRKLVME